MDFVYIAIGAIFENNIRLAQYLGHCPFTGVSKRLDQALGMGAAVIVVIVLASVLTWSIYHTILIPLDLDFMRTLVFILVIATLVQLVEIVLKKTIPTLYRALGIFLPLITTNCAVMGVALLNVNKELPFLEMLVLSTASAIGWALAIVLFAGIRERLAISPIPRTMAGTAAALVTAGIMSLAFMGFMGMVD